MLKAAEETGGGSRGRKRRALFHNRCGFDDGARPAVYAPEIAVAVEGDALPVERDVDGARVDETHAVRREIQHEEFCRVMTCAVEAAIMEDAARHAVGAELFQQFLRQNPALQRV